MADELQQDLDKLLREEPYVRALARSLAADDADEIVQQTWLKVCEHSGTARRPRAWLGRIVHNVTRNLVRREQRRKVREQRVAQLGSAPSTIELMQREERRRRLVELVEALPPDQREVMLLRYFEGLAPREIAARMSLPASAVWTLHRRAAERLRRALDLAARRDGSRDRRAWLLPMTGTAAPPLSPIASPQSASPLPLGLLALTISMTLKTKILASTLVAVTVALFAWWPTDLTPTRIPSAGSGHQDPAPLQGANDNRQANRGPSEASAIRELTPGTGTVAATTGDLLVQVVHGGKSSAPASGVVVSLRRIGGDVRLAARARTNADGYARFEKLRPGRVSVWGDRVDPTKRAEIAAGETTGVKLTLPIGMTIQGIVLDGNERPVAGASIETAMPGLVGRDPEVLAMSGTDGRFEIRSAPHPCLIGARAAGYRASKLQFAWADEGQTANVKLRLKTGGGTVEGVVVDPNGEPVAAAIVCVGTGAVQGLGRGMVEGQPPMPALVRTDAKGRFRALGVEPGHVPVWGRAPDMAPWRGSCAVALYGATQMHIVLQAGGIVHGTVRSSDGVPLAKVEVHHGKWQDFDHVYGSSDQNGAFALRGLPTGDVKIRAEHDDDGSATVNAVLVGGRVTKLELQLSRGLELRGRVRDSAGGPLAKIGVEVVARRSTTAEPWRQWTRTRPDGTFSVPNCPADRQLIVEFSHRDITPRRIEDVDPRKAPLDVRLERIKASSRIAGKFAESDGRPAAGVRVSLSCRGREIYVEPVTTGDDGGFAFDALPAGEWRLSISRRDTPSPRIAPHTIGAGERWDIGTIRLEVGGRAIIRAISVPATDLRFMLADTQSSARWVIRPETEPVTPTLRPGLYSLMVWGKRFAARAVPVTILAGKQTEVILPHEIGVCQRLEFVYDREKLHTYGATLAVYRGAQKIVDRWLPTEKGQPWGYDLWLLPGTYRVTLAGNLRGEATVAIGTTAAAPVRIDLR